MKTTSRAQALSIGFLALIAASVAEASQADGPGVSGSPLRTTVDWIVLKINGESFSRGAIDRYTEMRLVDELGAFLKAAAPATPGELSAARSEFLEDHYLDSLKRLIWDRILQQEATRLGYDVPAIQATEFVDREIDEALKLAGGATHEERVARLEEEIRGVFYPFDKRVSAAQAYQEWIILKQGQAKETFRHEMALIARRQLLAPGTPDLWQLASEASKELQEARVKYAALRKRAEASPELPLSELRAFYRENPRIRAQVSPAKARVGRLMLRLGSYAEYERGTPELFRRRANELAAIAAETLSEESGAQLLGDFEEALRLSRAHSAEELLESRGRYFNAFRVSGKPEDFFLAKLHDLAVDIRQLEPSELPALRAQLDELVNGALAALSDEFSAPQALGAADLKELPLPQALANRFSARTSAKFFSTEAGTRVVRSFLALAVWELGEKAERLCLGLLSSVAEEFRDGFQRLGGDFERASEEFVKQASIEARREDLGESSLLDDSSGIARYLAPDASRYYGFSGVGKLVSRYVRLADKPTVEVLAILGREPERFLGGASDAESLKARRDLQDAIRLARVSTFWEKLKPEILGRHSLLYWPEPGKLLEPEALHRLLGDPPY